MSRGVAAYAVALAFVTAIFLLFPGIDLWAAGLFYRPGGGFFLSQSLWVRVIYRGVPYLTDAIVVGVPLLYLIGRLRRRALFNIDGRAAAFLLLSLALGPGLLVNSVFKDHWGRARPAQVAEFGGHARFTPAPLPAEQCPHNCSFPAGHPAMGFYLVSFAFLVPEPRRRRVATSAAIACGAAVGVARMAAGGHFLSDVVFSGFIVCGVSWLLYRLVVDDRRLARTAEALAPPRWLAVPGLLLLATVVVFIAFFDQPIAWFFHDSATPSLLAIFNFVTQFGLGAGYLVIGAALFIACRGAASLVGSPARAALLLHHAHRALYFFLAVAGSGLLADIAKVIFGRARPKLLFAGGIYGFNWGATQADYWSFPSGHTTTIAAVAVALYLLWPRGWPLYLAAALLVAASRMIVTEHYASDVLVGAALGAGFAWALWQGFARAGMPLGGPALTPPSSGSPRSHGPNRA